MPRATAHGLRRFVGFFDESLRVETALVVGPVAERICAYAADHHTDLIVLGSHGRGASRFLLGSVSEQVSQTAPCGVLISRGDDVETIRDFQRILVAIDYSTLSAPLLQKSKELLAPQGEMAVIHVWNEPAISVLEFSVGERREYFDMVEKEQGRQAALLSDFVEKLDEPLITSSILGVGKPHEQILFNARELDVDLFAVGARHPDSTLEQALGTVADRILRQADRPVFLWPKSAQPADRAR